LVDVILDDGLGKIFRIRTSLKRFKKIWRSEIENYEI